MKNIILISILFVSHLTIKAQTLNSEAIAQAFKSGNAKELSKYFSPNVELKVFNKEDVYSKTQAEIIVKDFFTKNPPKNYVEVHNGTSKAGAQYIIGQLTTANGTFRINYFLKKSSDSYFIQELRFEEE
ncbi:MAG: DUF4783 domain-containing protein [Bacteroidetes bacterium]|nr:DUF4783 domain-containing protein [Bacteroidota bacterium]HET6244023.1 DUF4783 domain-containing protein [Bacteroidia bacterium]